MVFIFQNITILTLSLDYGKLVNTNIMYYCQIEFYVK